MLFYIVAGVASAIGILFLLFKLDIRKVLAFDIFVDIGASVLLIVMFAGTFAGMMAAVIAGSIISIVLYCMKKLIGCKKPQRRGLRLQWVIVPPQNFGHSNSSKPNQFKL